MEQMSFSRKTCFLAVVFLFALLILPAYSEVESLPFIRARVGWTRIKGAEEINDGGVRTGAMFELLDGISQNSNIIFEYVRGESFRDLMMMLYRGDVDAVCGVMGEDNVPNADIVPRSIGTVVQMLCSRADDPRFFSDDWQSYNGAVLAVLDSPTVLKALDEFEHEHGFKTERKIYRNTYDVKTAVLVGNADLGILATYDDISNLNVLTHFGLTDKYISVRKDRQELKERILSGYEALLLDNPAYMQELYAKYYTSSFKNLAFTRREQSFIDSAETIDVYVRKDLPVLSFLKKDKYEGFVPSIFEELSRKSGLKFNFIGCDNVDEIVANTRANPTKSIAGFVTNCRAYTNDSGIKMTDPVLYYPAVLVMQKGRNKSVSSVAYNQHSSFLREAVYSNGYYGKPYADNIDCLEAVLSGSADAALLGVYTAQEYLIRRKYGSRLVPSFDAHVFIPVSFATSAYTNGLLYSVLEKLTIGLSEQKSEQLLHNSIGISYREFSFRNFMEDNLVFIILVLLVFASGVFVIFLQHRFNVELEHTNRNKDVFLADMSHDFRTPLTAISGFAYLGKTENDPKYYSQIITSSAYMQELVSDILNIQQYAQGKALELQPEPVIAETLYDSILSVVQARADAKKIEIVFTNQIRYPYIEIDPMRVRQAFVNIINNAIKYSPECSRVNIKVTDFIRQGSGWVRASVSDQGEGMSREFIKQRLFRPFEREKNAFSSKEGGSGLGLAITKIILDRLGGNISVKSELGKGSTFTLEFPERILTHEDYERERKDDGSLDKREYNFEGFRVLLCEDNEINTYIVTNLLEKKGCTVDAAENGKVGVEKFEASERGHYNLVLMDIRMPVMDGIEAAKAIRALERDDARSVPIVALSANAFEEDKLMCAEAGMNAHLSKPIDVDVLFKTLDRMRKGV